MILSLSTLCGLTLLLHALSLTAAPEPNVPDVRFFCIHSSYTTYTETNFTNDNSAEKLDLTIDFAFYVHGWTSNFPFDEKDSIPYQIGIEWVKAKKTNFCGVDWRELANDDYFKAVEKHIKTVGLHIASFLMKLSERNVTMGSVTIAGHSLGAHIAGLTGKSIFQITKTKISTIFGLDPAGPYFTSIKRRGRCLRKNDAQFVQVLHTSKYTLGTSESIGHADFIVNNGITQDACAIFRQIHRLFTCSHSFALEIFLSTFTRSCSGSTNKDVYSIPSNTNRTDVYGIHNTGMVGTFTLETSQSPPYCKRE